ncbi:hypothetical protein Bca101_059794 [Brassica carinata]
MAASSTFFSPALLSNNRTPPPCCSVRPSISSSPVLITECGVGVKQMMVRRKNSEGEEEEDDSPAAKYALIYNYKEAVSGFSAGNEVVCLDHFFLSTRICIIKCLVDFVGAPARVGLVGPIDVVVQPGNTGFFLLEEGEGDDDEAEKTA